MQRRAFLRNGLAAVGGATAVAGCLDLSGDGGQWGERQPGEAPDPRDVAAPDAEPASFERLTVRGVEVPLVPVDVAHPWYLRRDARFVDARSIAAYERSHVAGAVLSPAPSGYAESDPVSAWPQDVRIVTYCTCPHHLSSSRAASLVDAGYERVYALDEGFGAWFDRDYPVGSASGVRTAIGDRRSITGALDPVYAGEQVRLRHAASGQREPAVVAADGSFEVTFRFVDVEPSSELVLETPAWTRTGTVAELTSGPVRR